MTVVLWEHKTSTRALGMFYTSQVTIRSNATGFLPLYWPMLWLKNWSNTNEASVCVRHCAYDPGGLGPSSVHVVTDLHSLGPFPPLWALHRSMLHCTLLTGTWWWFVSLCKTNYNFYVSRPMFPSRRQIPWRQYLFLLYRFSTRLTWELHKPYCFGHVGAWQIKHDHLL